MTLLGSDLCPRRDAYVLNRSYHSRSVKLNHLRAEVREVGTPHEFTSKKRVRKHF